MLQPIVPLLAGKEAYVPGLSREFVAKTFAIPPEEIAKLGSAENPFGPSPKALAAVESGRSRIDLYPDWSSAALRAAIGARYGYDPDWVACGSGETELISFIIRAFSRPGDPILMYEPCFPIYHIFAENEGRVPVYVPMLPELELDMARYISELRRTRPSIALITNPHSPTGLFTENSDICSLCEAAAETKTLVVLDEAYIHFSETEGGLQLTRRYDNLIALRTFSKAFGLAGLRLGFGIAHPDLIRPLMNIKPTWNLGQMQVSAGIAAIGDDEHVARTVKMIVEMRAYVAEQLAGLNRFRMVPNSRSNFFLLEVVDPGLTSTDVFKHLLSRGVIVKDSADSFRGLGNRFLRIDVSLKRHMDRLVAALKEVGDGV